MSKDIEKINDIEEETNVETLEENDQVITEDITEEVLDENLSDQEEEADEKGGSKLKKFFMTLCNAIADQTILILLTYLTFYLFEFALKLLGYEITNAIGIYFYSFVATGVLYFTITKFVLGQTLGEKIFNK